MKALKRDLLAISKGLQTLVKRAEALAQKIEKAEAAQAQSVK